MRSTPQSGAMAGLLAILVAAAVPARAESLLEAFDKVRPTFERQLRGRTPDVRIKVLKRLQKYPLADAVRMAQAACADNDAQVRAAAYATLLAINHEREPCDALVALAEEGLADRKAAVLVPPALAALLSSQSPIAQIKARKFLDEKLADSPHAAQIVLAIADSLAARANPDDVAPLARLSKSKVFDAHFGVRRGIVQALTRIPSKEAVGTLVGMLTRVGGEARADASEHLTQVTGQIFGVDAAAWGGWWQDAAATFVYPNGTQYTAYRTIITESDSGSYYGMPVFAERVVFVLDASGSMNGQRMAAAKRELERVITALPEYVQFGIVVFNGRVSAWQRELVKADAKMKRAAIAYIGAVNPHSNTASYDALEAAIAYDTEAIYFLSDGAPTSGKIVSPVDIVNAVSAANKLRRISIYTIGIAAGFPGSPTDLFLKTLSEQNFGRYRRIDG